MSVFGKRTATLCVLFLLPTFAASYAIGLSPQTQPAVEELIVEANEGSVDVMLAATEDVQFTYFRLDGPRLVLDLHDAVNLLGFRTKTIGAGGVSQVRAAPFSDETREVTRIVFDLEEGTSYLVVEDSPGHIRVSFEAKTPESGEVQLQVAIESSQESGASEADERELIPSAETAASTELVPVQVASLVPTAGFQAEVQEEALTREAIAGLEVPEIAVPFGETEEESVEVSEVAVVQAEAADVVESAMPVNTPVASEIAPAPVSAVLASEPFPEPDLSVLEGLPGPPALALTTQIVSPIPVPDYTGEIYDFDLRDVALQDFFRTVSDLSGLNVILDPNIPNQPLTMTLYQVPWDQALDIVLRNYNLAWELSGNVLRIASQDTLQAEEERRREYRELQEQNGPLVNNTYVLSYTQAATAAALVSDLLSARGTVVPVQERNAIIVTDIENRFDSIGRMVDFLDTPSQQVEIEARLLQANKTFRRDLGNQLGLIVNNTGSNILTGVPTLPSPFVRNPAPSATAGAVDALPLIADFGIAAPTAGLSFLLGVGGDVLLDEIIQVAETRGTARLLSRPNVVVQNNEAAIIEQGTQIPVQTNVNNTITVQFQQFALRLEVTPQITEEGTILLNAIIENSTPDFSQQVDGIPSVATQRAQTRVLIEDGATAMVGGILIDSDSVNVSQVPGLGSIPIIGNLFKSTSTIKGTSELLFFVTARIKSADTLDFLSDAGTAALAADFSEDLFALEPPAGILEDTPELAGPDFN